jgi:hypothetical protein
MTRLDNVARVDQLPHYQASYILPHSFLYNAAGKFHRQDGSIYVAGQGGVSAIQLRRGQELPAMAIQLTSGRAVLSGLHIRISFLASITRGLSARTVPESRGGRANFVFSSWEF